jgi:hypothetical protein
VVVTDYNPATDFKSKNTYSLPEDIPVLGSDPIRFVDPVVENYIFTAIRNNMATLGYSEVPYTDPPNVAFLVSATETTYYYEYSDCYYYWGYYYCYDYDYYNEYYEYAFTSYSLLMNMVDTNGQWPPTLTPSSALWIAGINGIKDDYSSSYAAERIVGLIDQAFVQSSYLNTN